MTPRPPWSRNAALALGAATLWPPLYLVLFLLAVLGLVGVLGAASAGHAPSFLHPGPEGPAAAMLVLFAAHCFTILLTGGLVVFYAVDVFRSPDVPEQQRVLWLLLLLLAGLLAMPLYWYLYLWRPRQR